MGGLRRWSKRRWLFLIAGVVLLGILAGTLWLLRQGTRGAEIANVVQLSVSMLALGISIVTAFAAAVSDPSDPSDKSTHRDAEPKHSKPPAIVRWVRRLTARTVLTLCVTLLLVAITALLGPPLAERAGVWLRGCDHPVELRVLASPDQLDPARRLADRYERWTAQRHYGCATVSAYVYAASAAAVRDAVVARWPDTSLRDVGPRPDVWLAESSTEVDRVRKAAEDGAVEIPIRQDDAIAWSPIVFGIVASDAGSFGTARTGLSWSDYVEQAIALDWDVVRPDPASSPVGELATAVLYATQESVDPARGARTIEQRIGRSLDDGGYPLGSDLDILCTYRRLDPPHTAVIVSEQALVRLNRGDPLGSGCGSRQPQRAGDNLLLPSYPSDTRAVEHRFVRFGWSGAPQDAQAQNFGRWLTGADGRRALVDVGLRPPDGAVDHPLGGRNGVLAEAGARRDPIDRRTLDDVLRRYDASNRRGRVLLALDGSGSMGAATGPGGVSRFAIAGRGVLRTLELMGERDEFGLSIFPAEPAGAGVRQAVAIGPRDGLVGALPRRQATGVALDQVRPAGGTPLFRAIVDGVAAVGPSDDTRVSALVVLTDGEDTTSGLTVAQVRDAVRGLGVRVFAVAVGEATCSAVGLEDVAATTGGRCIDADLASIDTKLTELFGALWSVG